MPRTYVSLDLETTGLDSQRDAIIEIGALRFEGDRVLETYATFVNPGRRIPPFVTDLTGITDADVEGAIGARQATRTLAEFVGRDTVIGHNISFDLAFLRQHGVLMRQPSLDTFELAGILVPHVERYSLANLVRELGIDLPAQTHRALDDAVMSHQLFMALMRRAVQLPQETVNELVRLGERVRWGPSYFLRDAQYLRTRQGFQGSIGTQLAGRKGGDAAGPLFVTEDEIPEPLEPRKEPRLVDVLALTGLLEDDGPIAETFSSYEYRDQQVEMMQAIAEAFNAGTHLMVEAGTGTGKSLAYLLPAIEWAVQNRQRVVISTNTINLQEQLASKDLPQLREMLYKFHFQVLKGRIHYLCRQQFEALRRRGPTSHDEMRVLAKVILWLPNTLDGDGDGIFLPTREERAVWYDISAANEACDPDRCPFFQSDRCFFYRARAKAEGAHILIVNHALLLADVAAQNRVLPEYDLLVVDEAHHLESATTEALRYTVSWPMLRATFDDLLRARHNVPALLNEVLAQSHALPRKQRVIVQDAVVRLQDRGDRVQGLMEAIFGDIERFMDEHVNYRSKYATRLRITDSLRDETSWDSIGLAWTRMAPNLDQLVEGLSDLAEGLDELSATAAPELDSARVRLLSVTRRLAETRAEMENFLNKPQENAIYWMEDQQRRAFSCNAVPLHVGELIRHHLLDRKRAVVLTSATLRISGSFEYMRERLGADGARELAVGSPFDYQSAALLALVSDIPEPSGHGYQKVVEDTLLELVKATEGRALVLFTSYSQLQTTASALTGPLARENITVYAQGSGGSRASLLESFRTNERAVLLGTRSFWEGVDIAGDALSCLVIVKLPFDVPNDPVIAARAEVYDNPFNEYMVPEAVLRFLQGFGRLIRTGTDQGIAVVLDQRILTKRYGTQFIMSLPDPAVRHVRRAELPAIARSWLDNQPLPTPDYDLDGSGDWSVPPPEEPPWFWGA